MKKYLSFFCILVSTSWFLSETIMAQEEKNDEVHIKITKNGTVIRDTTFKVGEEKNMDLSLEMIDLILGENTGEDDSNTLAYTTEDGRIIKITSQNRKVMVMDKDGKKQEIIIKKNPSDENKVVIIKDGEVIHSDLDESEIEGLEKMESNSFVFIRKSEGEGDVEIKAESGSGYRFETEDGKTIIITGDGEEEEKKVEVEVIEQKKKK